MGSTVVNPSSGTRFYSTSGSAITAQPVLKFGAMALGSDQTNFSNVAFTKKDWGFTGSRVYPSKRTQVISARLGDAITGSSVASVGGFAKYTKSSHGLVVGDVLFVTEANNKVTGIQRVTAVDGNDFVSDMPYVSGADSTISIKKATGTIALSIAGRYVIPFVTTDINGVASNTMKTVGSDYGLHRSIKKFMTAGRNPKTATSVRSNHWDEYLGKWSTVPSASNDSIGNVAGSTVTDGSADGAGNMSRTTPGELVFLATGKTVTLADYPVPTS